MNKNFLIVSNDRLYIKNKIISSNYNDTINIIEGLGEKNILSFYCRSAREPQNFISKKKNYNKFIKLNFLI